MTMPPLPSGAASFGLQARYLLLTEGETMSRAFVKDVDPPPDAPPEFETPTGYNPVTRRGAALIAQRIASIEKELASAPSDALKLGLGYWEGDKATAEIVAPIDSDEVAFGSIVEFSKDGVRREVEIVGEPEA